MAILRNLTGETARFLNAAGEIVVTLEPDEVVVAQEGSETVAQFQGVALRTLHPASFTNLPDAVAGTALLVKPGIALMLWERSHGRTDVYEPEAPIVVEGLLCYRGARRYID